MRNSSFFSEINITAVLLDYESKKFNKKVGKTDKLLDSSSFQALFCLPAGDGSRLQCVSAILIWLVLVLTDLWELFVDLLYN